MFLWWWSTKYTKLNTTLPVDYEIGSETNISELNWFWGSFHENGNNCVLSWTELSMWSVQGYCNEAIFTARKRSLRRLCFYRCLSVHTGGHAWFYLGGHTWFYLGGHAWFYLGGHAWFYSGGMRGFIRGVCMVLFGGACVVLFGGMCGFIRGGMRGFIWGGMHGFFSFFGYNEIRSMSGRYASYWNAFLFGGNIMFLVIDLITDTLGVAITHTGAVVRWCEL